MKKMLLILCILACSFAAKSQCCTTAYVRIEYDYEVIYQPYDGYNYASAYPTLHFYLDADCTIPTTTCNALTVIVNDDTYRQDINNTVYDFNYDQTFSVPAGVSTYSLYPNFWGYEFVVWSYNYEPHSDPSKPLGTNFHEFTVVQDGGYSYIAKPSRGF